MRYVFKILCKIYEFILKVYTFLRTAGRKDPSKILIDNYSESQVAVQKQLDALSFSNQQFPNGELLVIVPFRDRWDLTKPCLESLLTQHLPHNVDLRIALVDNGSISPDTKKGLSRFLVDHPQLNVNFLRANYEFNYSRLNNDAFRNFSSSKTSWVLFLNNDVEFRAPNIIYQMLFYLKSAPDIGVIGATLLYPNGDIQHLFAAPGVKIIAAHPLKKVKFDPGLEWFAKPLRPVAAVTGALMMLRADDFKFVGYFDEELATTGQDIDLCMSIFYKLGKVATTVTMADVLHKETATRKPTRPRREVLQILAKWNGRLADHPFYSTRISRFSEQPLLELLPGLRYPMSKVVS
jgi:GT2 family glycosyltransferase